MARERGQEARRAQPAPPAHVADTAPPGTRRLAARLWLPLLIGAVLPLVVHLLLYVAQVPLGYPGRAVNPYSPIIGQRLANVPVAALVGTLIGWAVWRAGTTSGRNRTLAVGLVAVAALGVGAWSFHAPPEYRTQHVLNMHSPAQDGAFVVEALLGIQGDERGSVRAYLEHFPQRTRKSPGEMRGTRVTSNPPGTTLLAYAVAELVQSSPRLRAWLLREAGALFEESAREAGRADSAWQGPARRLALGHSASAGFATAIALTALWLSAGALFYGAGRLFLPPAVAGVLAVCCVFTPATLMFTPGKDPAQLLTTALPLYLWLLAVRRGWIWAAALAGAVFTLSCVASLVHVWLAAIAVAATLLSRRNEPRELWRLLGRALLPAVLGAVLAAVALYWASGLNLWATSRAVAAAQALVTRGPDSMPLTWQVVGIPLFLLFAGPAFWTAVLWAIARPPTGPAEQRGTGQRKAAPKRERGAGPAEPADSAARLGRWLLIGAATVPVATVGFTNIEAPRLWIPFAPLVLFGAFLQLPALRAPGRRVVLALAALATLQIAVGAVQWSLMDVRESEARLQTQRYFQ